MANDLEVRLDSARRARNKGQLDRAKRDLTEALALARTRGDASDLARTIARLGAIERDLHNIDQALLHYADAADRYRSEGIALGLAHSIRHIGDIHQDEGSLKEAEPAYVEALAIYRSQRETPALDLANAIRGFALLLDKTCRPEEAAELWQEAGSLYAAADVAAGVAECTRRLQK